MLGRGYFFTALTLFVCLMQSVNADEMKVLRDAHGVEYVTGGIGSEEVEALEPFKKQFRLYFLFSEGKVGRVISNVKMIILDPNNQVVFKLNSAAPRLLLNLPTGKYLVVATHQGEKQRYALNHDANKSQRIILNWKNTVDEDATEDASATVSTP